MQATTTLQEAQHQLLTHLEADPQNTLPRLVHMYRTHRGDLADLLHTTWADARIARNAFVTAVQR